MKTLNVLLLAISFISDVTLVYNGAKKLLKCLKLLDSFVILYPFSDSLRIAIECRTFTTIE